MELPPLWAHQAEAISRAKDRQNFALFFEPGCGKSRTVIDILRSKYQAEGKLLKTLIFTPPVVVKNFANEWKLYSKIPEHQVIPLVGTGKQRLYTFLKENSYPRIFITNYESLLMDELYQAFLGWQAEAFVFDESHRLKNHSSVKARKAFRLIPNESFTYLLSGTPVLNSPMDLFMQYKVMDGGATFGDNFFKFRATYFYDANAGMPKERYFPNWKILPQSLDVINRKINETGMRVEKKDCLDLPPMVRQILKVSMTPEQAKAYAQMEKDFIAFFDSGTSTTQLAITKALRLQQITSGHLPMDLEADGKTERDVKRFKENIKLQALKEQLQDLTPYHKVLVWAVWKDNYAEIQALLDEMETKYVTVTGDISPSNRETAIEDFKTKDDIRVFLGHPGSGGIGINLTCAAYSIFYSRTFSLEHSIQAEARNYRGGSKEAGHEKITRIDLVCENTIDEEIVQRLYQKEEMSLQLIRANVGK